MGWLEIFAGMLFLLLLKGFYSGSEIALVSADKIQMRHRARLGDRGARLFLKMFQKPDTILTTTLVGTNLATVSLTSIGTVIMIELFGGRGDLYAFLFFTPILLIFGEVVPKSIYQQKAESLSPRIIYPLRVSYWLFFPIIFLFSHLARFATKIAGAGRAPQSVFITREQLRAVVEMTERRSEVAAFTQGRIRRAIRFGETLAAEVMTPLRDLALLENVGNADKLADIIRKQGHRPVPIYQGSASNIIGVVHLSPWKIMQMDLSSTPISDLVQHPYYAAPQQTLAQLLPILQKREDQAAIIVDEFGSAIGMVTIEEILGVVVGEVKVGYHYEKHPYRRGRVIEVVEDGVYILDARLPISELNDVLGLNLPTADYRTIGGMLLAQLRHVPREGEFIVDSGYRFTVVEATPKTVVKVRAEPET